MPMSKKKNTAAEPSDSIRYGFTWYLRNGLVAPSPSTFLFVISLLAFSASIVGGFIWYVADHKALPPLSLYVLTEGESLYQNGDFQRALKEFEGAAVLSPANAPYLLNVGVTANAAGDKNAAIDSFQRLLRVNSDHPDANFYVGLLYLERGQLEAAIQYISRSIQVRPGVESVPAHTYLGVAYDRKGEFQRAADSYRRALSLDPDSRPAQEYLDSLRRRMP